MNDYAFALMEISPEGAHVYSLYATRKAALKSGLALVAKSCQENLDFYRKTGYCECSYRELARFDNGLVRLHIEKFEILQ